VVPQLLLKAQGGGEVLLIFFFRHFSKEHYSVKAITPTRHLQTYNG
jgi:hypothetical protein